jgi:DNA-binding transcriptional MerR regulator
MILEGVNFMTITDVAKKYNVTADTLRYYEKIGLIPNVGRTSSGIRNYCEEDCQWIEFIRCMRGAGLPVAVLIEYVKLFRWGDETIEARKDLLVRQRDKLAERITDMQGTLARLNAKIDHYEKMIVPVENGLKNGKIK